MLRTLRRHRPAGGTHPGAQLGAGRGGGRERRGLCSAAPLPPPARRARPLPAAVRSSSSWEGWGRAAPGAGSLRRRLPERSPPREPGQSRAWAVGLGCGKSPQLCGLCEPRRENPPRSRAGSPLWSPTNGCGRAFVWPCGSPTEPAGGCAPGAARARGEGRRGAGALGLQSLNRPPFPPPPFPAKTQPKFVPAPRRGWGQGGASRHTAASPPGPGPLPGGRSPGPPTREADSAPGARPAGGGAPGALGLRLHAALVWAAPRKTAQMWPRPTYGTDISRGSIDAADPLGIYDYACRFQKLFLKTDQRS